MVDAQSVSWKTDGPPLYTAGPVPYTPMWGRRVLFVPPGVHRVLKTGRSDWIRTSARSTRRYSHGLRPACEGPPATLATLPSGTPFNTATGSAASVGGIPPFGPSA
jgi:hypothetical protein